MIYSDENYKKAKPNDCFEFVCKKCGKTFLKTKKEISKSNNRIPVFCSQDCNKQFYKENCYIIVNCENCGKEKKILKSDFKKSKNKKFFCNHSCSAIYNNKLREKKTKYNYNKCPICGELKYKTSELCKKCSDKKKKYIKNKTLGDFIEGKQYLTSKCNEIRRDARQTLEESKIEKVCAFCKNHEFDDILEVHHIKGILDFKKENTIKEINSLSNLIWLCPNHHKMLEKGLITLTENMINKELNN